MVARLFAGITLSIAAASALAAPKIQHWTLENGARVYFVEARDIPMIQVRAVFDAGAARDANGKSGAAVLANHMLNQGAGSLDADAIAARFESLGAEFSAGADRDMAGVNLRSLSDRSLLEPALDLLATILREPTFPQPAFERERARALVGLQRDAQNPGTVIEKAFYRALYGTHPYAAHTLGDEQSLKAITREDLVSLHRRHYVGRNAWLVIVGDADTRAARRIAEQVIGGLPAGETVPVPPAVAPTAGATRHIAFPATQSHIRLGAPTMTRPDPDFFALHVGNYVLGGGGFVSRLTEEVREKRGYSYSVYSYFLPMRAPGPFQLGLQTRNANRDAALKLVRAVLEDFIANGPNEQELVKAKRHLTGSFPLRLDSNGKIAEQVAVIAFYGLPLDWLERYTSGVEAVTAEQIRDAFRRRLKPAELVTVTLGG
jgi:zinc protease